MSRESQPRLASDLGPEPLYRFFNHRTHRTHGNESSHRYLLLPWFRCVPWFHALGRQKRLYRLVR